LEAQESRFEQLLKIINEKSNFSINDVGCGYANLFDYLKLQGFQDFRYYGSDISEEMIKKSLSLHVTDNIEIKLIKSISEIKVSDYSLASGLFNSIRSASLEDWSNYITESLIQMNQKSLRGFAFNMLTSYSDEERKRDDLYYGDPLFYFDYCKKNFSNNIALLHDYDMYDFTILVRK
jgi:SAM-dependent methyltransferase